MTTCGVAGLISQAVEYLLSLETYRRLACSVSTTARLPVRQSGNAIHLPSGDRHGFLHAKSITVTIINLSCCFSMLPSLPSRTPMTPISSFVAILCCVFLCAVLKKKDNKTRLLVK